MFQLKREYIDDEFIVTDYYSNHVLLFGNRSYYQTATRVIFQVLTDICIWNFQDLYIYIYIYIYI